MQTASFIEALQADLRELASLGGDEVAAAADRLAAAIRSSAGLRLLDALSEAALEISAQLPFGHVDIRVAGQDPQFVYVEEEQAEAPAPADDGMTARISLRLPESLKASVEAAAAGGGGSGQTGRRPGLQPRGARVAGRGGVAR